LLVSAIKTADTNTISDIKTSLISKYAPLAFVECFITNFTGRARRQNYEGVFMKTRNRFYVFAVFAIFGIVAAFTSCDPDKAGKPGNNGKAVSVLCACNSREHYMPCDCGAADCACTVIPRGYLTDEGRSNLNIPIYQSTGVGDDAAVAVTGNIQDGYAELVNGYKDFLAASGNFREIWIIDGQGSYFDSAAGIVKIGVSMGSELDEVKAIFTYDIIPNLSP
jgi:hypothetical protein